MKYLKIDHYKGYYLNKEDEYKEIDKIDKIDLINLLNLAVSEDEFEIDEYKEDQIKNIAHQIIYRNIHDKLKELFLNRDRFRDESNNKYKEVLVALEE